MEKKILIPYPGGRIALCDEESYRGELFEKFKTAAIIALLVEAMDRMEDPNEFRFTLIKTWSDKVNEERSKSMTEMKKILEVMKDNDEAVPEQLSEESLEEQQQFFDGIMQEMTCDLRAMLNNPKEGGV